MTRGYSAFGKLARELAGNLDVLVGVDQAEVDDNDRPVIVGRITRPNGSCYEVRVTLLKEGEDSEDDLSTPLSKSQQEAVAKAKSKRKPAKRR